jgi:hypothetical protein
MPERLHEETKSVIRRLKIQEESLLRFHIMECEGADFNIMKINPGDLKKVIDMRNPDCETYEYKGKKLFTLGPIEISYKSDDHSFTANYSRKVIPAPPEERSDKNGKSNNG